MINLSEILSPELTLCNAVGLTSKKQVFEKISQMMYDTHHDIQYQAVLEVLQQRERLGSTVIGNGVAIPHGRVANLDQPQCVLLSLDKAIEFDSSETVAIDLIFGLVVPQESTEEHLQILKMLVEKLQLKTYREKLRVATTNNELYQAAITEC